MILDAVSALSQLVLAVSAAVGAAVAVSGLTSWKKELRGRTEYELARRVLGGVYRVRNAIGRVRSPLMFSSEYQGRPNRPADAQDADADDLLYAYEQRCAPLDDAYANLEVDVLEAETVWPDAVRGPAAELRSCMSQLYIALGSYIRMKADAKNGETIDRKHLEDNERVIRSLGDDNAKDDYGVKVASAVKNFETLLRPHLQR